MLIHTSLYTSILDYHGPMINDVVGDYPGDLEPALADRRVRAKFYRPDAGFHLGAAVPLVDGDLALETIFERLDARAAADSNDWLIPNAGNWTAGDITLSMRITDRFAELGRNPTHERILAFAGGFGWLTHPQLMMPAIHRREGVSAVMFGGGHAHGEPLAVWTAEAARFAVLRDLWQAGIEVRGARKADDGRNVTPAMEKIDAHVKHAPGVFDYWVSEGARENPMWQRILNRAQDRAVLIKRGDRSAAAEFVVAHEINLTLQHHVHTTLLPFRGSVMRQVPDCLLAAIYLQFANEVVTGRRNPRVRECANPDWSHTFTGGRSDKKYCSDGCRNRKRYLDRHPTQ